MHFINIFIMTTFQFISAKIYMIRLTDVKTKMPSTSYSFCLACMSSSLFCSDDRCLDDALYSRHSLNSRASSNSTSGVVSDKMGSEADKGHFNNFLEDV